jgi:hypothetical protein
VKAPAGCSRWCSVAMLISSCSLIIESPSARYDKHDASGPAMSMVDARAVVLDGSCHDGACPIGTDDSMDAGQESGMDCFDEASCLSPDHDRERCLARTSACEIAAWDDTNGCSMIRAADCTACGAMGRCVSGECLPDGVLFHDDFEREELGEGPWSSPDGLGWAIVDDHRFTGERSVANRATGHSSTNRLLLRLGHVPAGAEVSFWYRTESEYASDRLTFQVVGDIWSYRSWSGNDRMWAEHIVRLSTSGELRLEWAYEKDSSVSYGKDRAWIDDVQVRLPCPSNGAAVSGARVERQRLMSYQRHIIDGMTFGGHEPKQGIGQED